VNNININFISVKQANNRYDKSNTDRCMSIVLCKTFYQAFRSSCDYSDQEFYKRHETLIPEVNINNCTKLSSLVVM